jgi:tellurite resistance-related uncharacterized protein
MPIVTTPKTEQDVIDFCKKINTVLGQASDRVVVYCEITSYATGQVPATFLTAYNAQNNIDKQKSLLKGQLAELAAYNNGTTFTEEFDKIN